MDLLGHSTTDPQWPNDLSNSTCKYDIKMLQARKLDNGLIRVVYEMRKLSRVLNLHHHDQTSKKAAPFHSQKAWAIYEFPRDAAHSPPFYVISAGEREKKKMPEAKKQSFSTTI